MRKNPNENETASAAVREGLGPAGPVKLGVCFCVDPSLMHNGNPIEPLLGKKSDVPFGGHSSSQLRLAWGTTAETGKVKFHKRTVLEPMAQNCIGCPAVILMLT